MLIIAVDPGLGTGVAELHSGFSVPELREFNAHDAVAYVHTRLTGWGAQVTVVCERHTITAKTGQLTQQLEAIEVIGALRYLARIHGAGFTLQSRSVKSRVPNSMLETLGWRQPPNVPMEGHARDAARHLLVYLAAMWPHHPAVTRTLVSVNREAERTE